VSALLDWPDNSDDSDDELEASPNKGVAMTASSSGQTDAGSNDVLQTELNDTSSTVSDSKYSLGNCHY